MGFGDAVTPEAQTAVFPTLLNDFPAPTLKAYPVYTVIAEKYQAMVMLGLANSRMKDFYDLAVIARRTELDGATLADAIRATYARRSTALPTVRPIALTSQFSENEMKGRQWQAFLNKNRLIGTPLAETVALLDILLWRPTEAAVGTTTYNEVWAPQSASWQSMPHVQVRR